ncbi:MAG TPA: ABC transporter ATP-binding protein [Candidatus Binataceae bacterium]|jgi:ABC-2 type transport system ATP-binding protein|nr:ABC transporter ATP-binding protein [Candidatus Binataceae bacterium]
MSEAAVVIRDLTKTFFLGNAFWRMLANHARGQTEVLRGISLEVGRGEALALLGPNGAGKTTSLEIISTLLLPTSGRVTVCGYDVVRQAAQVRRVVGYCPSNAENFYPRLSGIQNLEFFAMLNNLSPLQARDKIQKVLELIEMDEAIGATFQSYSEGMKQRLAIARALVTDPEVLLMDEPTRSLDPLLQGEIRRFLRDLVVGQLGKTLVLVTHSLQEAEQVCGRIAILNHGRIVNIGTPAEIQKTYGGMDLSAAFQRAVGAPA